MPDPLEELFSWLAGAPRPSARPVVTVSYAQSIDGSIAAQVGGRLQLSGPETTRMTHRLRAAHDAIMIGIGTLLADDPQLNVREAIGEDPRPVIVDTHLRTPSGARVLRAGKPPIIAAAEDADGAARDALLAAGADIRHFPTTADGLIPPSALVSMLASMDIHSLMIEGGARLITSFVNARLVDRAVVTICPCLVGGMHATQPIGRLASGEFPRLIHSRSAVVGEDIVIWGEFESLSP
jgi:GTP cyclohydrolase II